VLVMLSATDTHFESLLPGFEGWLEYRGGATRAATVSRGLDCLIERGAHLDDWVLVHDAARCLIRPEAVDRLIDACLDDEVGGLLALPVADTLKRAWDDDDRVGATVARSRMWQAQTPQMFRIGLLRDALMAAERAGVSVTDEASAVESLGHAPRLVRGDMENLKVTFPPDFALAARLLRTR
jgi:2-C-methyl-D-erythritol 4-phosphate cytidylyltransferase